MFFSGATELHEQPPPSLFMSYLICPAISFVPYEVAFWDGRDQTHIFLVCATQPGVKQHEGLVKCRRLRPYQLDS